MDKRGLRWLIKEAAQDGRTELDLSRRRLTSIPAELGNLTNLRTLDLSSNELTSIPAELGNLTSLTMLNLGGNRLTSLPAELGKLKNLRTLYLGHNRLTSVPAELGCLTKLETLLLNSNQLTSVPAPLDTLPNLEALDLQGNQLTSVPAQLGKLTKLTRLNLDANRLTSVPAELGNLTNLTWLNLSDNKLTSVPAELGKLINLKALSLVKNQIKSLAKELLNLDLVWWYKSGLLAMIVERFLCLGDNPLTNPPVEVIDQGRDAVRRWFESLEAEGEQRLNEVKVLLVGYGGAGKTSLVRRLTTGRFRPDEVKTHGVRIKRWRRKIDDEEITVHLWDYGGQGIMQATHRVFFSHRCLYVLVIDARQESDPEEWLSNIETMGGDSPVLVVVNKIDEHTFGLNETGLRKKYPNINGFYKVSCKTGSGIDLLKRDLPAHLSEVEMAQMTWPKRHAAVKGRLARLRRDYIRYGDYQAICVEEGVYVLESQKELIAVLHELGAILYFSDRHLQDTQVLNPEWVTGGIYKLINSPTLKEVRGKLPREKLDYVLNQERLPDEEAGLLRRRRKYDPSEQTYIVELMNKFGLCYELGEHTILVPDLLTEEEPSEGLPEAADVRFYFEYDFLPAVVMPQFMVASSDDLDADKCWRTGAVLRNDTFGAVAVVRKDKRHGRISIEVTAERPREYLTEIRDRINQINGRFQKLDVIEWVPLPGAEGHAVEYLDLIGHEKAGRKEMFVGKLGESFNVAELLGSIESPEETKQKVREIAQRYDFRGANIRNLDMKDIDIHGDSFGTIGSGSTSYRDVIQERIQKSTCLDDNTRDVLLQAFEELKETKLDDADRRETESHLEQITQELEKPKPKPSRLKKLWGYVNVNAPAIATILQGIELIGKSLPH